MKKVFGLIGKNLEHSFSRNYFEEKFKKQKLPHHKYINIDIKDISTIRDVIKYYNINGLNINCILIKSANVSLKIISLAFLIRSLTFLTHL